MLAVIDILFNQKRRAMLEFKKNILTKVSFDLELFEKELKKALKWLMRHELIQLKNWCYQNFKGSHRQVIEQCFSNAGL